MTELTGNTASTIKAIETIYNGYRFRSRLEARWAVFFDTIGLKYNYEHQGYDLGKFGPYLPDFWFPTLKIHCEIKPLDQEIDEQKYKYFRDHITPIILIKGAPWEYFGTWFGWDLTDSTGGSSEFNAAIVLIATSNDGGVASPSIIIEDNRSSRSFHITDTFEDAIRTYNFGAFLNIKNHENLCDCLNTIAILRAKKARFEHGESP